MSEGRQEEEGRRRGLEEELEAAEVTTAGMREQAARLERRIEELEAEGCRRRGWELTAPQVRVSAAGRRAIVTLGPGSRASSGIGSGCGGSSPGPEWIQEGRVAALEQEAERLASMVGALESREEQLAGQVEEEGAARRRAEGRAAAAEGRQETGRRLKSALLLTAAFGAAHTALRSDLVMECLPM
jgi:hypothetical protein